MSSSDYVSRIERLEQLRGPVIGFYKKTYDYIRVRNRQRTRLCYHVVDFLLYRSRSDNPSDVYGTVFYTYNDIDIRWFKRSANVWVA